MKNDKLVKSIQREVFQVLSGNDTFMKLYSENQLQRKIKKNIKEIYTNVIDYSATGWCDLDDPIIVFCAKSEDEEPLTMKQIKRSADKRETLIHEAVHAVLKNKYGTGMLHLNKARGKSHNKVIQNISSKRKPVTFNEIGRGFNEGYTNWVVEKCGIDTHSYSILTSINRQIEICIGEDEMMKFSKGNFRQIFKSLNMTEGFGTEFFRQLDDIYQVGKGLGDIYKVERYLRLKIENLKKVDGKTIEDKKEEDNAHKEALSVKLYKNIFTKEVEEQEKSQSQPEERIKLYEDLLAKIIKEYEEPDKRTMSVLIDFVETKIIQSLVVNRMDNPIEIDDFERIMDLLGEMNYVLKNNGTKCIAFENLRKKVTAKSKIELGKIYLKIDSLIEKGNFTVERLKSEYDKIETLFPDDDFFSGRDRINKYAGFIGRRSEYPEENEMLVRYILEGEHVDIADRLSIQRTKSKKGIIFENGELRYIVQDRKNIYEDNENMTLHDFETFEDKIDWTIEMDGDYQLIIDEFEKLRAEKLAQNPDIEILITNATIVFKDKNGYEFYDIIEDENPGIRKAELETEEPINFMCDKQHKFRKSELGLTRVKDNFFMKIRKKLQDIKLLISQKDVTEGDNNVTKDEAKPDKQGESFRESLRRGLDARTTNEGLKNVDKEIRRQQGKEK